MKRGIFKKLIRGPREKYQTLNRELYGCLFEDFDKLFRENRESPFIKKKMDTLLEIGKAIWDTEIEKNDVSTDLNYNYVTPVNFVSLRNPIVLLPWFPAQSAFPLRLINFVLIRSTISLRYCYATVA
jgi:hypothetical protein